MYCGNCGNPVPDKASFCVHCGAPVQKGKPPKKKKRTALWILLSVMGLLVLFLLIGSLGSGVRSQKLDEARAQALMDDVLAEFFQEAADQPILQILEPHTRIRVEKLKKQDGGYIAECTATSLDLERCVRNYLLTLDPAASATYGDAREDLLQALESANTMEGSFRVEFTLSGGQYVPVFSQELMDFCSGNLSLLLEDLAEMMGGAGL